MYIRTLHGTQRGTFEYLSLIFISRTSSNTLNHSLLSTYVPNTNTTQVLNFSQCRL